MTDPTTHSQPAVDPALVARVKGILLQPKSEWLKIDGEFATTQTLFTRYAMILAAIGPICLAMGLPLGVLPLLLAVEVIPDIFRTVGNVTADLAATRIVNGPDEAVPAEP